MAKRNILVLAHEAHCNGASLSLLAVLHGLMNEYNFLVIVPDSGPFISQLEFHGINYKILHIPRCGYFGNKDLISHFDKTIQNYTDKKNCLQHLILLCESFKPDIIYSNTSVIGLGHDLALHLKKPHIWHIREYGDLDFNIQYIPTKRAIINQMSHCFRTIFTTHLLKKHWVGNAQNAVVIYNGIQLKPKTASNNPKTDWIIGIVGMLHETKGHAMALEIMRDIIKTAPNTILHIYGKYSEQSHYFQTLNKFILDNKLHNHVKFMGYTSHEAIYNEIDVLLSCAKDEGFGRTIIEAMSAGIPVVARNAGGPSEIIHHDVDGYLFHTSNESARLILSLMNNPDKYHSLREHALQKANTHFSLDTYIASMHNVFESAS